MPGIAVSTIGTMVTASIDHPARTNREAGLFTLAESSSCSKPSYPVDFREMFIFSVAAGLVPRVFRNTLLSFKYFNLWEITAGADI